MCTVQLPISVTAAYVMRRVNRGQNRRSASASGTVGPDSVRRSLFSESVDHDLTARELSTAFAEIQREATRRWNFDFGAGRPLQGRYEWYPVAADSETDREEPLSREIEPERQHPVVSETVITKPKTVKRPVQSKLTDFMTQRKRPSSSVSSPKSTVTAPTKSKVRKTLKAAAASSAT